MEIATSSGYIINIPLNFNFKVFLFQSTAITSIILIVYKLIALGLDHIISFIRYKGADKFKRRMEEIKELNNKTHDRLVEIEDAIEKGKTNQKAKEARIRLLYSAARLKKYDKTISNNIYSLLKNLSFKENDTLEVKNIAQVKKLIKKIGSKIDKLWFGIS